MRNIRDITKNDHSPRSNFNGLEIIKDGGIIRDKITKMTMNFQSSKESDYFLVCPATISDSWDVKLEFKGKSRSMQEEFDCYDKMIDDLHSMKLRDFRVKKQLYLDHIKSEIDSLDETYYDRKFKKKLSSEQIMKIKGLLMHSCSDDSCLDELFEMYPDSYLRFYYQIKSRMIENRTEMLKMKPNIKFPRFEESRVKESRETKMMRLLKESDGFGKIVYDAMISGNCELIPNKPTSRNPSVKSTVYKLKTSISMREYREKFDRISDIQVDNIEEFWRDHGNSLNRLNENRRSLESSILKELMNSSICTRGQTEFDFFLRQTMDSDIDELHPTKLFSVAYQNSRIYQSVARATKKYRECLKGSSTDSHMCCISIEVSDEYEYLVITNLCSSIKSIKDHHVCVVGKTIQDSCSLIVPHGPHNTKLMIVSPDELNWGVISFYKFLSVYTMFKNMSNVSSMKDNRHKFNPSYLYCLSIENKMKTSNMSELTRYIVINATGISNGNSELFEKLFLEDNFQPKSPASYLYCMRLIKMSFLMECLPKRHKAELNVKFTGGVKRYSDDMATSNIWTIAMPYEESFMPCEDNVFNSMYFCKFLYHEHSNKVFRELKIIEGEIKHSKAYHSSQRVHHHYERPDKFVSYDYKRYEPDPHMHFFSAGTAIIRFVMNWVEKKEKKTWSLEHEEMTFKEILQMKNRDKVTPFEDFGIHAEMMIRKVLNPKGSMSFSENVVNRTEVVKVPVKKNGENVLLKNGNIKTVTENRAQNDKCWSTSLLNVQRFMLGNVRSRLIDDPLNHESKSHVAPRIDSNSLKNLLDAPNTLMPCLVYNLSEPCQYASRAVDKNGRGSGSSYREIHVLNSEMRIGCYFSETVARQIRNGMPGDTNVMESKMKDKISGDKYKMFKRRDKNGNLVFFDNADCSKWGIS